MATHPDRPDRLVRALVRLLFAALAAELLLLVVHTAARRTPGTVGIAAMLAGLLPMLVSVIGLEHLTRRGVAFSIRDAWRRR